MLRPTLISLFIITPTLSGCASHHTAPPAASQAAAVGTAPTKAYMLLDNGRQVLRLSAPADAPCELSNGAFEMKSRDGYVNVWLVRGATSIDEGVQKISTTIVSEFKDFKPTSTTSLPLSPDRGIGGGGSAARVMGSGVEADDNDPGTADVIVFQKGGKVFIACTHGESMRSTAQDLMVNLVLTATTP